MAAARNTRSGRFPLVDRTSTSARSRLTTFSDAELLSNRAGLQENERGSLRARRSHHHHQGPFKSHDVDPATNQDRIDTVVRDLLGGREHVVSLEVRLLPPASLKRLP